LLTINSSLRQLLHNSVVVALSICFRQEVTSIVHTSPEIKITVQDWTTRSEQRSSEQRIRCVKAPVRHAWRRNVPCQAAPQRSAPDSL